MSRRHVSKYRERRSRTSSASRVSDRVVNPTRSANSTETNRRSEPGSAWGGRAADSGASAEPHSPQNFTPGPFDAPQVAHTIARGDPHSPQNFRPTSFSVPQTEQITQSSSRRPPVRGSGERRGPGRDRGAGKEQ